MKVKTGFMLGFIFLILFLTRIPVRAEVDSVSTVRTLTVEECVSIALKHNANAVIAQKSVESAAAGVWGAVANFLPQLNAS